jgi:hypothetical protein
MRLVLCAAAIASALGAGCKVRHPVVLDIDSLSPISCVHSTLVTPAGDPLPLAARVVAPEHASEDVLLVFDFFRASDFPRCSAHRIALHCAVPGNCIPVPGARACVRVGRERISAVLAELGPDPMATFDSLSLSEFVEGSPQILGDAPEGPVIVRMVPVLDGAAVSPCPAPGDRFSALPDFDPSRVFGCGYSCPVVLEEASVVEIDFDNTFDGRVCTEEHVAICAGVIPAP